MCNLASMEGKAVTPDEIIEFGIIYETRLGILCGAGTPNAQAKEIAAKEAREHIEALRFEESLKHFTAHDSHV